MPVAPDLRGIVLDERYELDALIGEGAFGRVYRGRDRRLDRPVAIKVIKPWWSQDPEWARGFTREARILARCSDPGIVAIHDVGEGPEGPYFVSELVVGEDLAQRLRRGAVGEVQARAIAVGLCRGLAAAHRLGIVHRDVKPGNVLLADDGGVKVTDFGVARLAEATSAGALESLIVGTPRYMAPEQARGGSVTAAADVYSAGAVLYELLAGRAPFEDRSPVALALAHLADPPPPLPATVPGSLRRVVQRALAKDPAQRFTDAGEMARALEDDAAGGGDGAGGDGAIGGGATGDGGAVGEGGAVGDGTLRAPRRTPLRIVNPSGTRRRVALLAVMIGVLAALVAAAVLVSGGSRHRHVAHAGRGARAVAAPVEVPLLIGEDAGAATARLHALGLRVAVVTVPAPGIRPGTVTSESPIAGRTAPAGGTVRLSVAEVPRWRTVATFSGRRSPVVRIVGARWRIVVVGASAVRHCTLWLFCSSTHASVTRVGQGSPFARVDIVAGVMRVFDAGPGSYEVGVDPASGSTRWSIRVQDDY